MTPQEKQERQKLLAAGQTKLQNAVNALRARPNKPGWCLGYTREALAPEGLHLPPAQTPESKNNTALWNFKQLSAAPGKWGWQATSLNELNDLALRFVLVFFNHCATLPDGRMAGHIAIWDRVQNVLYSSNDYGLTPFWRGRICGLFLPEMDEPGLLAVESLSGPAAPAVHALPTVATLTDQHQIRPVMEQTVGAKLFDQTGILTLWHDATAGRLVADASGTHGRIDARPVCEMMRALAEAGYDPKTLTVGDANKNQAVFFYARK